MKILLTIHHELDPNAGAPGVTWQLGQEYQKLGHEVQYYSFDNLPQRLPAQVERIMFPTFVASHIAAVCRKQPLDVVDASTGDAWVWAKIRRFSSKKNAPPPLLVTRSHGLEHIAHLDMLEEAKRGNLHLSWKYPLYHGGFLLWEVANSMRNSDLVLLLNQRDAEYAINNLNVHPQRTRIVANGIPTVFLNLPFQPLPAETNSPIRIAQVGSYIRRKGIHYGTPALNSIMARYPHVSVSFFGTGCPPEQVYADFDPTVRDRIQVVQRFSHEQLPSLLCGHHIKLFPSLSEGFALSLIEAMACGLAPVTTAIGGAKEIVRHEHNGILIPTRDSQAIEQALERLITDSSYLDMLRRNAHAIAQQYSWERIARENLALYEEAIKARMYSPQKLLT
jgi:glycosyltransferase involved in cell wall biosynthesis